jgi:hypothetical protein
MTTPIQPFSEPWHKTAARAGLLALAIGLGVGAVRHRPGLILPVTLFALWFTLGGHFLEVFFLNHLRRYLGPATRIQLPVRLLYWFVGGSLIYGAALVTMWVLPQLHLPDAPWWLVGLAFLAMELLMHGLMAMRSKGSAYSGRG